MQKSVGNNNNNLLLKLLTKKNTQKRPKKTFDIKKKTNYCFWKQCLRKYYMIRYVVIFIEEWSRTKFFPLGWMRKKNCWFVSLSLLDCNNNIAVYTNTERSIEFSFLCTSHRCNSSLLIVPQLSFFFWNMDKPCFVMVFVFLVRSLCVI